MKKIKELKENKKPNFLEWNINILTSSFKKINLNIILIVALDALFYLSSGFLFVFWWQRIQAKSQSFNLPSDIASMGYVRIEQITAEAKAFYYMLIVSFILLLLAIIFLASILKGIIWAKTTNTKVTFAFVSKFFGLNLIWMSLWFILLIIASFVADRASVVSFITIMLFLGIYLTNILYTLFMRMQSFGSILGALRLGITKIHLFALPYALILLVIFILLKLSNWIIFRYSSVLLSAILLFYLAFVRFYASELTSAAETRQ